MYQGTDQSSDQSKSYSKYLQQIGTQGPHARFQSICRGETNLVACDK